MIYLEFGETSRTSQQASESILVDSSRSSRLLINFYQFAFDVKMLSANCSLVLSPSRSSK